MKYTFCEWLVWRAMTPVIFDFLKGVYPGLNGRHIKAQAKRYFKELCARTPDIGRLKDNPLRLCLSGGMVWLAVYRAVGVMTDEVFAEMVKITMTAPLIKRAYASKKPFSAKAQRKKLLLTERANRAGDSLFNWQAEFIPGRNENEYTVIYRRCGLCALGRQEGLERLIPYMCEMDFISIDLMGGVLHRTRTLAAGGDCCDFYVCKKESRRDQI